MFSFLSVRLKFWSIKSFCLKWDIEVFEKFLFPCLKLLLFVLRGMHYNSQILIFPWIVLWLTSISILSTGDLSETHFRIRPGVSHFGESRQKLSILIKVRRSILLFNYLVSIHCHCKFYWMKQHLHKKSNFPQIPYRKPSVKKCVPTFGRWKRGWRKANNRCLEQISFWI